MLSEGGSHDTLGECDPFGHKSRPRDGLLAEGRDCAEGEIVGALHGQNRLTPTLSHRKVFKRASWAFSSVLPGERVARCRSPFRGGTLHGLALANRSGLNSRDQGGLLELNSL